MNQGEVLTTGTIDGYQALGAFGQPVHRSYVQLRATIEQRLGARHANFFARPQIDERTRQIRWVSPVPGPARRWADLAPDEQAGVALDLAILRAGFQRCLEDLATDPVTGAASTGGAAFAAVLTQALQTPNDGHLHIVGDQPVATFWGFSEYQRPGFDVLGLAPAAAIPQPSAPVLAPEAPPRGLPWWYWLLALLALLAVLLLTWWFWPRPEVAAIPPATPALPEAEAPKPADPLVPQATLEPEPKPEPVIRDRNGALIDRSKIVIDRDGVVTDRNGVVVGRVGPDGVLVPGDGQTLDPALLAPDGTLPDGTLPDGTLAPDGTLPDGTLPDGTPSDAPKPEDAKPGDPLLPEATIPDPAAIDPNATDPATPDPLTPDPNATDPNVTDPANPDPAATDPNATDPTNPDPNAPGTGQIPPPPTLDPAAPAAPPLTIPEATPPGSQGAAPGLGFVQGRWRSQSGLVDQATGRQLDQTYEFDDKGQGTAVIRRADGVECRAPAQAVMQDGKLQVQELDNLRCADGRAFEKSTTICERDAQGRTRCRGANAGGTGFDVRIERAQP